jgi:hypothetical protein
VTSLAFARTVLGVAALAFAAFGLWALFDPVAVAGQAQVQLPTPTALADGRAVYGGVTLGLGLFFALCAAQPALVRSGLWALLASMGGPFLGRLIGVIVDGARTPETLGTLAFEFAFVALAGVALLSRGRSIACRMRC